MQDFSCFRDPEALNRNKVEGFPLFAIERQECFPELCKPDGHFPRRRDISGLQIAPGPFSSRRAQSSPAFIDEDIMQDRHQPDAKIGTVAESGAPFMCPQKGRLDKIVGRFGIAGQDPRITAQRIQVSNDIKLILAHGLSINFQLNCSCRRFGDRTWLWFRARVVFPDIAGIIFTDAGRCVVVKEREKSVASSPGYLADPVQQ